MCAETKRGRSGGHCWDERVAMQSAEAMSWQGGALVLVHVLCAIGAFQGGLNVVCVQWAGARVWGSSVMRPRP